MIGIDQIYTPGEMNFVHNEIGDIIGLFVLVDPITVENEKLPFYAGKPCRFNGIKTGQFETKQEAINFISED